MLLDDWVNVREFDDLELARANRFWVRDDQMPAVLVQNGMVLDDPPGLGPQSPWGGNEGEAAPAIYELWVQKRDEVRATHILNMHHKVTFEVNPTPLASRIVVRLALGVTWLAAMFEITFRKQWPLQMVLAVGCVFSFCLIALYVCTVRISK